MNAISTFSLFPIKSTCEYLIFKCFIKENGKNEKKNKGLKGFEVILVFPL